MFLDLEMSKLQELFWRWATASDLRLQPHLLWRDVNLIYPSLQLFVQYGIMYKAKDATVTVLCLQSEQVLKKKKDHRRVLLSILLLLTYYLKNDSYDLSI